MLNNSMYTISNVLGLSIIIFNKISIGIKVCKLSQVYGFMGLWVYGFMGVGCWVLGQFGLVWFVCYLVIGVGTYYYFLSINNINLFLSISLKKYIGILTFKK